MQPHLPTIFASVEACAMRASYRPCPGVVFHVAEAGGALSYLRTASHIGKVRVSSTAQAIDTDGIAGGH